MNSLICIDANIIVWSLVPSPLSDAVETLLQRCQQESITLIAPALLAFEVTSTLRRLMYLREITAEEGEEAFAQFLRLTIRLSHQRGIFGVPTATGPGSQLYH